MLLTIITKIDKLSEADGGYLNMLDQEARRKLAMKTFDITHTNNVSKTMGTHFIETEYSLVAVGGNTGKIIIEKLEKLKLMASSEGKEIIDSIKNALLEGK